jgi:hypothetical protein
VGERRVWQEQERDAWEQAERSDAAWHEAAAALQKVADDLKPKLQYRSTMMGDTATTTCN